MADIIPLDVQSPRFARVWAIIRTDGLSPLYITDHDKNIELAGLTFSPVFGFQVTTRESENGSSTLEMQGIVDDSVFKLGDFLAQRYEEAKVTEVTLDWKYPWRPSYRTSLFWMGAPNFEYGTFSAPLEGYSRFMKKIVGKRVSKLCPLELFKVGDGLCNASKVGREYTGVDVNTSTGRTNLTTVPGVITAGLASNRFEDAKLTWTGGSNSGLTSIVRIGSSDAGGGTYTFNLYIPTPYDIGPADEFTIEWGCNRTIDVCNDDFANVDNHGGEAHTPGPDLGKTVERSKTG